MDYTQCKVCRRSCGSCKTLPFVIRKAVPREIPNNTELTAFYLYNHEINPVAVVGPIELFPNPATKKLGFERVTFAYPLYNRGSWRRCERISKALVY